MPTTKTATVRITLSTNAFASNARAVSDLVGAPCRHNGGKVVIATVDADELDAVCDRLDAAYQVTAYDVAE